MSSINFINKFTGYQNYQDITNMPVTSLAPGSQNVFIQDGSKLEPRAGMAYLGAEGTQGTQTDSYWTLAHRIHSKYDEFVNKQGIKIPLRVYYEGRTSRGDVMEAWLPVYEDGVATDEYMWYQVTATTPSLPVVSTHRWYWAEWFDPALTVLQPELIFTYGANKIGNWSGGFAPIIAVTGTTITTTGIWTSMGFIASPEGANVITVNGVEYTILSGIGTDTITVASTAGIDVNDVAFQNIYFNDTLSGQTIYDVCSTINNQVYYIDWRQRNVYISWDRNQVQNLSSTIFVGTGLDDLVFSTSGGGYTGTIDATYRVTISKAAPAPVNTFSPVTVGNADSLVFTGTHTGSVRDVYKVVLSGIGPTFFYDIYLNNSLVASSVSLTSFPYLIGNGISVEFTGTFPTANAIGDTWTYTIGGQDSFQWNVNGGTLSSSTLITGGNQSLSNGVRINFDEVNGHTVGDSWTIIAYPTVIRGWSNFSYTNPNRRPGQGFTILLDSNGWTMQPQESRMLINAQAGHYYDVEVILSSDLLTETVKVTRLKSEPQNKVLFPYLIGYIKNQLAVISNEKTYDILGRQKFLELQQLKTLSDAVRIDFETVDWEDADILYFKRKIFFNVPRTTEDGKGSCIFVWDDYRKYWHTPQVFGKRISLLSVINDMLIGHSYEQNESYQLFTGLNDLGIFPISTKMVFPYDGGKDRYDEKATDAFGVEGYILGNPVINYTLNMDVGGCGGQAKGTISPWNTKKGLCIPSDTASLGKSSLGVHGLGNDPVGIVPHFLYINEFNNMQYYQRNIELTCEELDQRWSITSIGTSLNDDNINSESITDKSVVNNLKILSNTG